MTREEHWNAYLSTYADYEKSLLQLKVWATAFTTAGDALASNPLKFSFAGLPAELPAAATTGQGAITVATSDWAMPKPVMEELQKLHMAGLGLRQLWSTMSQQSQAGLQPPPDGAKD